MDNSLKWGSALKKITNTLGFQETPTVAMLMTNSPEWPIVFIGTLAVGGVATPVNMTYNPSEFINIVDYNQGRMQKNIEGGTKIK